MDALIAMKTTTLALVLVLVTASAPADDRVPEPTAFESFVANPNVIVEFEQWVGSIVSADAKLSVTALVAYDSADPARRMQGLRLTMEDNSGTDSVYVDDAGFAALTQDLASVDRMRATLHEESGAPYRVAGTASCWMPARPLRILCPSYRTGPDWSGLLLAAQGGNAFEYPDHEPAELAVLIGKAAQTLATRQRARENPALPDV